MSLQLEQNLYSIYRLCLKLPRYLFVGCLIFLFFIAATQILYMNSNKQHLDVSQCLLNYVIDKRAASNVKNTTENGT